MKSKLKFKTIITTHRATPNIIILTRQPVTFNAILMAITIMRIVIIIDNIGGILPTPFSIV